MSQRVISQPAAPVYKAIYTPLLLQMQIQVHSFLQTFSLLPATAAAAGVAAAHRFLILLYGVGFIQVGVISLSIDRHAGGCIPSLGFKTAVGVLRSVPVVRALQCHWVDDDRAGVVV